ncbi:MAG: hypothetical protein ACKO2L_21625 [Planctomycetaceae bacterium]
MILRQRWIQVSGLLLVAAVGLESGLAGDHGRLSTKAVPGSHCAESGGGRLSSWLDRKRAELRDNVTGYPQEFLRPPLGMATHGILAQQRMQVQPSRTTLYRCDFVQGSPDLNTPGWARLVRISRQLQRTPGPLLIETSEKAVLDEARKAEVIEAIGSLQHPLPPELVQIIGGSEHGLDSDSGLLINQNRLQQTRSQGSSGGASGGSIGSAQQSTGLLQ